MITYNLARAIVDRTLQRARAQGYPPMTVAVLDSAGQLVAFAREDGSSLLRERIARGKAKGALNMGVGSRTLAARAAAHPQFVNALVELAGGELVPVPGGVLIRAQNGELLGAVGVSGHSSNADEECAVHAIVTCELRADPGEGG